MFGELPKTSTGKIQKFLLREKAQLGARDRHMSTRANHMSADPTPILLRDERDGICTLTLNRPRR